MKKLVNNVDKGNFIVSKGGIINYLPPLIIMVSGQKKKIKNYSVFTINSETDGLRSPKISKVEQITP